MVQTKLQQLNVILWMKHDFMTKFKLPTSDMFGMVAETATNLSLGDT